MKLSHDAPQHSATFRFYAELNDFLPAERRQREFLHSFKGSPAVKDAIEAIGVPHPEVDLVVVGGLSVGFDHRLCDGDTVSVYPVFEALDISPVVRLRPEPLRVTRFVADVHLGKLARALRLLGFDTAWQRDATAAGIIALARAERRIILTRDRMLLKSNDVTHAYWIRHTDPGEQLRDVVTHLDLRAQARPFARCTVCNGDIAPAEPDEARREAPERVRERHDAFYRCQSCGKLYWKGTHFDRLEAFVAAVISDSPG